jgi:aldehyde:ferredoxin oxidoreductase
VYEKNADGTRGAFLAKFDYEPVNLLSTNIGIHDPRKAATLISLVDRLGMDNISLGTTISYVMDYNERHPDAPILNGATFGDFDKARALVEGAATGRFPEVGRGVKRLSEQLGRPGTPCTARAWSSPRTSPTQTPAIRGRSRADTCRWPLTWRWRSRATPRLITGPR